MAAGAFLSGSGTASAATGNIPSRIRDTFDRVIDVTDEGVDNTGSESITGALERLRDDHRLQDGTLLYFPSGRYYMDRKFRMTGFDNFGMYGDGATLVPADYYNIADGEHKLFRFGAHYNPGRRFVFENFDVDMTAPDTGVRVVDAAISGRLEVRDVHVLGKHDSGAWGPGRFVVTDPDGTGLVERFTAREGGEYTANAPHDKLWRGPSGIICNAYNRGRMTFEDCELGGFPDNGLYAATGDGQIRVRRGVFRNSNGCNVRVGGPDSIVYGATVEVDQRWDETNAQRGIRIEKSNSIDVENCYVRIAADTPNSHGISVQNSVDEAFLKNNTVVMDSDVFNHAVSIGSRAGDVTVLNTNVELNTPGGTAFCIEGQGTDDEWALLEGLEITGTAGHKWNRAAIYNRRNNVEVRDVTVDQTGGKKRRAMENFGDDCTLYLCDFTARQYPLIDTASGTHVEECRFVSTDDHAGVHLLDSSSDVYLKRNEIQRRVNDKGCDGLRMVGNTFL